MCAGMFFTRHKALLEDAFAVDTRYMPTTAGELDIVEPHRTSMQWSRRFIGLKLFLTLLVAGLEGYERTIRRMTELGDELRSRLSSAGFRIVNQTPLPVVCFQDARHPQGATANYLRALAESVVRSGEAWISTTVLGDELHAMRACITNFRHQERDLDSLVTCLNRAREDRGVDAG